MSMMSDVAAMKTAMEVIRVSDVFVERVPDKNWRRRAADSLPPSAFFSVRGVARINEAFACIEFNLGATNEEGRFLKFPTAKADRNGVKVVVSPTRPNDHSAQVRCVVEAGIEVPVLDECGMPVLSEAVPPLPAGTSIMHIVKCRVNVAREDIAISNVEVTPVQKDGVQVYRTLNNVKRPCYRVILHDSNITVVKRERIELEVDGDDEVVGASYDWKDAVARRNAVATQATLTVSRADAAIEAAAAAGAALR